MSEDTANSEASEEEIAELFIIRSVYLSRRLNKLFALGSIASQLFNPNYAIGVLCAFQNDSLPLDQSQYFSVTWRKW